MRKQLPTKMQASINVEAAKVRIAILEHFKTRMARAQTIEEVWAIFDNEIEAQSKMIRQFESKRLRT